MPARMYARPSIAERIAKYSRPEGDCIRWLGAFRHNEKQSGPTLTIDYAAINLCRWLLEQRMGRALDRDKYACHKCGNSWCINVLHLYEGTPYENVQDAIRHGTQVRVSKQHNARINDTIAWSILLLCGRGHSYSKVARALSTSKRIVSTVVTGETWRHVESPEVF